MEIIYSGGYNKHSQKSIENSIIFTYYPYIKHFVKNGKKVAFVTLAKPNGYYNSLLLPKYEGVAEIIDTTNVNEVSWSTYDLLLLLGGNTIQLVKGLKKNSFSINNLKDDAIIVGDSAGAYALSSYFYDSPAGELRGVNVEFYKGLNPDAKVITVAHKNNLVYCNDALLDKVQNFAPDKDIRVLVLKENEQKLLEKGNFVEVDKENLFKLKV